MTITLDPVPEVPRDCHAYPHSLARRLEAAGSDVVALAKLHSDLVAELKARISEWESRPGAEPAHEPHSDGGHKL